MPWWFEVLESKHELQNPTSADKILLLGERMGLAPESVVLDVGCGRAGPAVLLASTFGSRVTGVERSEAFVAAARARAVGSGVDGLVEVVHADGATFLMEADRYDGALCLGASFIWGGLEPTVAALTPVVHADGFVAVGEPYWKTWPLPGGFEAGPDFDFSNLAETVKRFEDGGVELVTLIASSEDDWDRYVSLQWHSLEEWLRDNPEDPEAESFREMGRVARAEYLGWQRDLLGWAIFVGRKR